ncbi:MAG TPA: hypothetical protein VM537_37205 [Anaerolineae bacterium]|nr:hypothetical protein [Anaerolineae bacterium]
MSVELISVYVSGDDRLIFKGARLIRSGERIRVDQANYWKVEVGIGMPEPAKMDFLPGGYDGSKVDLLTNSSNSLTGLEVLSEPLPAGMTVVARVTKVGDPAPLVGTSIQAVVGWADTP